MAKHLGLLNDISHDAVIRAAREAVAGAVAGNFPIDPIIGPELSEAISIIGSAVKRHGGLIESAIAGALIASDRFLVFNNVSVPVTKGASQLLTARNSDKDLARIKLAADSEAEGIVTFDLLAVDPENGWAGAYEIKRGNGATEPGKRRRTMHALRAGKLVLPSYVKLLGYGPVDTVTTMVIDYYGGSGFDPHFTLTREDLDEHFGVPVVKTVDAVTEALREELQAALPRLFSPFLDKLPEPDAGEAAQAGRRSTAASATEDRTMDEAVLRTLRASQAGPGLHRHFRPNRMLKSIHSKVPRSMH